MFPDLSLPKVIGHRGAKGLAPENTLISFKKAHELGAQWVELDVKETHDGILIVMHDEELARTANFIGKVAHTPWSIIKNLDAGSWFSSDFAGERIPTLEQAIQLFATINLKVNIEIKPCPNKETSTAILVANFIKNKWPKNLPPPLVSSFNQESLKVAKQQNSDLIIGALLEKLPINWKEIAREVKASTIHLDESFLDKKTLDALQSERYPILAYTVNSQKRAEELFSFGVTSVFTDFPWREKE